MKKQLIAWYITAAITFVPNALYFMVNGYWWLFDGNMPNGDKMSAAFFVAFFSGMLLAMWYGAAELWRK